MRGWAVILLALVMASCAAPPAVFGEQFDEWGQPIPGSSNQGNSRNMGVRTQSDEWGIPVYEKGPEAKNARPNRARQEKGYSGELPSANPQGRSNEWNLGQ
ncbi:MAG: hypothetical protein KQJ78_10005 [Deltaproteobacteria bacterium]|nr:hypothetical protein [Deltaproteobacteria bacterium]